MEQNYTLALDTIRASQEQGLDMFKLPTEQGMQPQTPQQPIFGSLMQSSAGEPSLTNQVQSQLKKLQIDPTGLSFSPVGRIQLQGRLEKQFGPEYLTVPGVSDILNSFDDYLKKNSGQTKQDFYGSYSAGKRTLNALLGGK